MVLMIGNSLSSLQPGGARLCGEGCLSFLSPAKSLRNPDCVGTLYGAPTPECQKALSA
jgi:hypothetical protein